MVHNAQVTLVTLTASGATVTRTQTTVFCGRKSVTYKEFYAAIQVGLNPQYIFEFDINEYESSFDANTGAKPTELIYAGTKYNIIRTFETTDHLIEVTVGL